MEYRQACEGDRWCERLAHDFDINVEGHQNASNRTATPDEVKDHFEHVVNSLLLHFFISRLEDPLLENIFVSHELDVPHR